MLSSNLIRRASDDASSTRPVDGPAIDELADKTWDVDIFDSDAMEDDREGISRC